MDPVPTRAPLSEESVAQACQYKASSGSRVLAMHTASSWHVAVGSTASAKSGSGFPLRAAGLSVGVSLGRVVGAWSLTADGPRGVAGLSGHSIRLVGANVQGAQAANQSVLVLRARGAWVTWVNGLGHGVDVVAKASRGSRTNAVHATSGSEVARGCL